LAEFGQISSIKHHPPPTGELKKLEKTTVDEGIFIEVKICVGESKVVAASSERRSSSSVALRWKKVM